MLPGKRNNICVIRNSIGNNQKENVTKMFITYLYFTQHICNEVQ